jgi:hypothetical protein
LIFRANPYCFVLLAGSLSGACAAPRDARTPQEAARTDAAGVVAPVSEAERQTLANLEQLPADSEKSVGGVLVVAGAPYHSASGRTCRNVTFKGQSGSASKLACKSQDQGWVFVPTVFAGAQGG